MALNNNIRQEKSTEKTSLHKRMEIWQSSVEACQRQIELAQAFQETGQEIINQLQNCEDLDPLILVKQYQLCLSSIDKGSKIERDARKELEQLQYRLPK